MENSQTTEDVFEDKRMDSEVVGQLKNFGRRAKTAHGILLALLPAANDRGEAEKNVLKLILEVATHVQTVIYQNLEGAHKIYW